MAKTTISVTKAARNFAECVNRAHYQNITFVLLKNGSPVARLVPENEKICLGLDLAEALGENALPADEARAWRRDLHRARKILKPPADKWQ
jgi:antitoxin (DNA-binding transcriptional repressor) of toxin-antitoxin stability system